MCELWQDEVYEDQLEVQVDAPDVFPKMLGYLEENGFTLAGAVHDFTDPADGQSYMFFPIEKL